MWFLVYQQVLPQLHLPTSSSTSAQDSVFDVNKDTENPVQERSGSMSGELRGNPLHETTETENKNINGESEEVQRDISHELPDWLQEFTKNLVDESTSTRALEKTEAHGNVDFNFNSLSLKGNGSILKHNDHMIISVMKCSRMRRSNPVQ